MKPIPQPLAVALIPRLLKHVVVIKETGCWAHKHVNQATGYAQIGHQANGERSYFLAHRVAFVAFKGPIPEGLEIDHECEVRCCVNPAHLRAMTHAENVLRSKTNPAAINARRTECPQGHPLPPRKPGPGAPRACVICRRIRANERNARKRRAAREVD